MYGELARGRWSDGFTTLSVVDGTNVDAVAGYADAQVAYEFRSTFDAEDEPNPPAVTFTPAELHDLIQQVKVAVPADPFVSPDFSPLKDWIDASDDPVLARAGSDSGARKEFRMKYNDETGTPYIKVQRWVVSDDGTSSHLYDSPTMGKNEFEGIFSAVSVP